MTPRLRLIHNHRPSRLSRPEQEAWARDLFAARDSRLEIPGEHGLSRVLIAVRRAWDWAFGTEEDAAHTLAGLGYLAVILLAGAVMYAALVLGMVL